MSTKAICMFNVVVPSQTTPGMFHAIIGYAGVDPEKHATGSITLLNQSPDITVDQIKQAVKDYLTLNHQYVFAPEDTVRFVGALS